MSDLSVAEELRIALVGFGLDKDLRRHLVHAVQRLEERLAELEGAVDLRCSSLEEATVELNVQLTEHQLLPVAECHGNGDGDGDGIPF